jgi:hypothetical protein
MLRRAALLDRNRNSIDMQLVDDLRTAIEFLILLVAASELAADQVPCQFE